MKRQGNKKVGFSLFSARSAVFLFGAVVFAITYIVEIMLHTTITIRDDTLPISNWAVGLIAFLTLSVTYTTIILIYRRLTVKNPVLRILDATEKIGSGDFSVRLPIKHKRRFKNEYDVISENINAMTQELSAIETLRHDFVSNVSHEFKSPLAVIQNCCTILSEEDISAEDRRKYAKNVSDASKRLSSMITNILKLNKIETQSLTVKNEKIDLPEQLREEILIFEDTWSKKNIDIDFESEEGIITEGDRELMSLMWTNILSNAFKFTPENGKVSVKINKINDRLQVSISDTGEGIPEDKLPRIFEKFYQCDSSHVTEGNGLGLALVKSICDMYGYNINVTNNPEGGCRFTVTLTK